MIAGHFGLAAMAKSRQPQIPLWALMLATAWLDIVFVPLYLTGIETLEPAPGASLAYGGSIIHAVYTHSLAGAVLLSAVLGLAAGLMWNTRAGLWIGAVSFSHWLLDLVVHRHDLPLLPANAGGYPQLGFGLWQSPAAAAAAELLLVAAGAWLYWRAARRAVAQRGRGAFLAAAAASLVALCGGLVLVLDVTRIAG